MLAWVDEILVFVRVVLDIDSTSWDSFDDIDAEHLERIIAYFFRQLVKF